MSLLNEKMSLLNESDVKYTFFPPVKNNKLKVSSRSPVYIETNLGREKQFLEISVNKFDVLTNQPKPTEILELKSFNHTRPTRKSHSFEALVDAFNFPRATGTNTRYKWNTANFPRLKVVKKVDSDVPLSVAESLVERKKKMLFKQKNEIESQLYEKSVRQLRSMELHTYALKVGKRNRLNTLKNGSVPDFGSKSKDTWDSIDPKDIKLKREIIEQMYSNENRGIRCYRQWVPDFFRVLVNDTFERMQKETAKNEEKKNNC